MWSEEIIHINDGFYVLATSSFADTRTRVLKRGDSFAVFDQYGDIHAIGIGEQGIYHEGTRFLSRFEMRLGKKRPLLLSSSIDDENNFLFVDLTNMDVSEKDRVLIPRGTLHIGRMKFILNGRCYERIRLTNYGNGSVDVHPIFRLDVDYADIFEVRGLKRERRGQHFPGKVEEGDIIHSYQGLDGILRKTCVSFDPAPDFVTPAEVGYEIHLDPHGETEILISIQCELAHREGRVVLPFDQARTEACSSTHLCSDVSCGLHSDNEQFNEWMQRSLADLGMMVTETEHGSYPFAGVPWFCTPFGRDGIITALQVLWLSPEVAKGVLGFLAATQAKEINPAQEAEPGKIMHEMRKGEMVAVGEVPFGLYYGSADATPLFVTLANAYYERTGDKNFIASIWKNIEAAILWIGEYGDRDGDGFVEYARHHEKGLINQGWKDSQDSVFHEDGRLAEGPIALCEVQGYVYAAKMAAAHLAAVLGFSERAVALQKEAHDLKEKFEKVFWSPGLNTYVMALDGEKNPCHVRSSNAGHCLFSGIASHERALATADLLLSPSFFSGWGIRTIPKGIPRYNPMSYHNGSIWPHDNSLIAMGMARYGFKGHVLRVMEGLFDVSLHVDLYRLPELYCGFDRHAGQGPTLYPVACLPQAWASASAFMMIQACLGLQVQSNHSKISFNYPVLPAFIDRLVIRNLKVCDGIIDLEIQRHPKNVGVNVLRRDGDVEVVIVT